MNQKILWLVGLMTLPAIAAEPPPGAPEWPLTLEGARAPIILYQPQPETFKDDQLTARAAVAIQPAGKDPVFGAVWLDARISTDRDARLVTVEDIQVPRVRFAGATPEKEKVFSQILAEALTQKHFVISLDRLLVSLENAKNEAQSAEGLKNDPPKIYLEKTDALLLLLDGEPVLRPVKDSKDQRVVNTLQELTFKPDKTWRLQLQDRAFVAPDLKGPWKDEVQTSSSVPKIILSKEPAELIVSKGEPAYTPLPGNDLLYMSNSDNNVFIETASSKFFVLLSGRWFTAASLKGPWTFVRPDQLPAAFAKIPPDSPKGSVLASVAGTEAAQEALMDAQIPQTAVISRKELDGKLQVTWEGEPKFKDLEVLNVSYSINSSVPVFQVGKEGYWACADGIWYTSKTPVGPWMVASHVPKEIYQVPPKCPYYHCRYVHIFQARPDVVYVGYYPGYMGSYSYYGTVVYGTGYDYSGWYGTSYYYPSVMFTWGFSYCYYPYYGWGGGGYYRPIGGYPGHYPRGPHVEHHGGQGRQNIYNRANQPGVRPSTRPTTPGSGASAKDHRANNAFADHDGNVSRRTSDGKWQDQTGGGWKDSAGPKQDVARDSQARDRGAQRASQYQATSRPSYSGGGMPRGGGMRGGGGRR